MLHDFRRVLILNRGEIACRLIQAVQELGKEAVAVVSDADKDSRHGELADQTIAIGGRAPKESYLNLDKLVKVAKEAGCDAVHPGYGFLSERAAAAEAFNEAGIHWVGPKPESILLLGDKLQAKKILEKHKVPTTPWAEVDPREPEELKNSVAKIGYPVLLKAASGGGGKGMRLVKEEKELLTAAETAAREAESAFGDSTLLVEKYVERPRHIEVQIMGDRTGKVVHFGERECSLQRRHQKVIEEAPAGRLSDNARKNICESAVRLAAAVGYENAGTVEFLVDEAESFYFLEVNSRLQVEHSVTEAVWGIDLVKTQILIAQGATLEELFPNYSTMKPRGHAIQARLYAEDPAKGFAPSPGILTEVSWPTGVGLRIDTGVRTGSEISLDYDAMVAKLTVHAEDRERAIARLLWALRHTILFGVTTNLNYLQDILARKEVHESRMYVKFLETELGSWRDEVPEELKDMHPELMKLARGESSRSGTRAKIPSPWESQ